MRMPPLQPEIRRLNNSIFRCCEFLYGEALISIQDPVEIRSERLQDLITETIIIRHYPNLMGRILIRLRKLGL